MSGDAMVATCSGVRKHKMKVIAKVSAVALLVALGGITQSPSYAANSGEASQSDQGRLSALAGVAVPTAQLSQYSGQGGASIAADVGSVTVSGAVSGVTGNNSLTSNSVSNSAGIITIFQNTGNNSLLQNSTSINITTH
jgi:hypothetical protein